MKEPKPGKVRKPKAEKGLSEGKARLGGKLKYVVWGTVGAVLIAAITIISLPLITAEKGTEEQPPASEPAAAQAPAEPAEFKIGSLRLTPSTTMVGESVTMSTTVANTGGMTGTYTAILTVDGEETGRKDVSVGAGQSKEVSFAVSTPTVGDQTVAIGHSSAVMTVHDWSPYTIKYDTGLVGSRSSRSTLRSGRRPPICFSLGGEFGHTVHFTPPVTPFRIQKIRIYGETKIDKRSDADKRLLTVTIWNNGRTQQLWAQDFPWSLFPTYANWREVEVPDIRVGEDFHVDVVTYSEGYGAKGASTVYRAVGIGWDWSESYIDIAASRPETRSGVSYTGKLVEIPDAYQGLRWFIRVEGEGPPSF